MDELKIKVEARAETDPNRYEIASKTLASAIKTNIGVSARVEVLPVGGIERSAGKAVRVIDHREKN